MQENFQYKNITIGTDPEFFIQNNDGKLISSIGIIEGTKDIPNRLKFLGAGFAIQKDNVLGEFNVPHAYSAKEITNNISIMKAYISGLLESQGLHPVYVASGVYDDDQLTSDEAKEFGCSPDYNAWTGTVNPPPDPGDPKTPEGRTRCLGGHIHFGWDDDIDTTDINHILNCRDLVKQLDYYLGAWALKHDKDVVRRRLYGKAGACRIKPYGVEYRTLSSFWVMKEGYRLEVWNRMQQAIEDMRTLYLPERMMKFDFNNRIIDAINTSKIDRDLWRDWNFPFSSIRKPERMITESLLEELENGEA